jgi:hypothetical protein
MTQIEKRKEIAKFNNDQFILQYDFVWNDLMEVVAKIKELNLDEANWYRKNPVMNALMDMNISILFNAVYNFCAWYNRERNRATQTQSTR